MALIAIFGIMTFASIGCSGGGDDENVNTDVSNDAAAAPDEGSTEETMSTDP